MTAAKAKQACRRRWTGSRTEAEQAADAGIQLVVLTDRATSHDRVPVSALLGCRCGASSLGSDRRNELKSGLAIESGEAREVHHFCLLIGYGADAINPYLAFESLWQARRDGLLDPSMDDDKVVAAYRKGVAKGMLKVMAKMGISTLQSYKGAQIFEALGLTGRSDRQVLCRYRQSYPRRVVRRHCRRNAPPTRTGLIPNGRKTNKSNFPIPANSTGEPRAKNMPGRPIRSPVYKSRPAPTTKTLIGSSRIEINEDNRSRCTLRGLLDFKDGVNRPASAG